MTPWAASAAGPYGRLSCDLVIKCHNWLLRCAIYPLLCNSLQLPMFSFEVIQNDKALNLLP